MPHRPVESRGKPLNLPHAAKSGGRGITEVAPLYERAAPLFDAARTRFVGEENYLAKMIRRRDLPRTAVLDLGCGTGQPIARYFIQRGCALTGVDAAPAMIALCRERFPEATWIEHDMRTLDLGRRFDAIVAWDSFFHLTGDNQRAMFPVFGRHIAPGGMLLFTSGPKGGEGIGDLFGEPLYHASLDTEEYRVLLSEQGFEVARHRVEDPDCGGHTVWLADKKHR